MENKYHRMSIREQKAEAEREAAESAEATTSAMERALSPWGGWPAQWPWPVDPAAVAAAEAAVAVLLGVKPDPDAPVVKTEVL
jgi:hypothetical protein